jgi:tetratricopeptide (TPR) repeat protein
MGKKKKHYARHVDPGKERVFRVVLLSIPLLFFLLLEAGLRISGYGGNTDLFIKTEWKGIEYYSIYPGVVDRYFSRDGFSTYTSRDMFRVNKSENTYRIFCLGASTTIGFPYMFNASYSALLRDRLTTVFPERHFEVVNVGITAVNSYTVADIARELVAYEPDLFIVYTGHNEFYGALGVGSTESIGKSRSIIRMYLSLQKIKTVRLINDAVLYIASVVRSDGPQQGGTLMEEMVGSQSIPYNGIDYTIAMKNFRLNLEAVVESAQRANIAIILSTVVSNLRDQHPFYPEFHAEVTDEQRNEWQTYYEQGERLYASGDREEALDAYRHILVMDTTRADVHFRIARILLEHGEFTSAREHFVKARDYDMLRFRASSELNDIIRRIAADRDIVLADMEKAFDGQAPYGIPGNELFWEHVHPTFDGYFLMAKVLRESMAEAGIPVPANEWDLSLNKTEDEYRIYAGVTEFDHAAARMRIEILTSRWPFRQDPVPVSIQPTTGAENLAYEYIYNRIGWGSAHAELAKLYFEEKDFVRLEQEYRAIAKSSMHYPHYMLLTGDAQVAQRKHRDAIDTYRTALRIEENQYIHARIAVLYIELSEYNNAAAHFQKAFGLDTIAQVKMSAEQRRRAHYLFGIALARSGDAAGATSELEKLKSMKPGAPEVTLLENEIRNGR